MKVRNVTKDSIALTKGSKRNEKLLILVEGKIVQVLFIFYFLKLNQEGSEKILIKRGEVFGEQFIYNKDKETFNNNYVHECDGIVSEISLEELRKVL